MELSLQETAAVSTLGTSRKQNEDRWDMQVLQLRLLLHTRAPATVATSTA